MDVVLLRQMVRAQAISNAASSQTTPFSLFFFLHPYRAPSSGVGVAFGVLTRELDLSLLRILNTWAFRCRAWSRLDGPVDMRRRTIPSRSTPKVDRVASVTAICAAK